MRVYESLWTVLRQLTKMIPYESVRRRSQQSNLFSHCLQFLDLFWELIWIDKNGNSDYIILMYVSIIYPVKANCTEQPRSKE